MYSTTSRLLAAATTGNGGWLPCFMLMHKYGIVERSGHGVLEQVTPHPHDDGQWFGLGSELYGRKEGRELTNIMYILLK